MPKQKRQPGIHLHKTAWKSVSTGKYCEWYWILIAKNGRTIARSSETYKTKRAAIKSIEIVAKHFENNQHYTDHTTGVVDLVVYKID
jgi:uncharacterized protein YegP (UPF0339 family)